jgi:hypothetical protein
MRITSACLQQQRRRHTKSLLKKLEGKRHILPTPGFVSIATSCWGGVVSHLTDVSARDAYVQYVKDGVIRDHVLAEASWGSARTMALFQNLQNPLWHSYGYHVSEFVNYVPRALETYTDTLGRLVMESQEDQQQQQQEPTSSSGSGDGSGETKIVVTIKEEAVEQKKMDDSNSGKKKDEDGNDTNKDYPSTIFSVNLSPDDNAWIQKARNDPNPLAGRLSRMTTPRMFHDHFVGAELFQFVNNSKGHGGLPSVTYVAGSSVVHQWALLSAQIDHVVLDDDDDSDNDTTNDEKVKEMLATAAKIEQQQQQQPQAPQAPQAPPQQEQDAASPPVAARMDVLYEIQQSYRPNQKQKRIRKPTTTTTAVVNDIGATATAPTTAATTTEYVIPKTTATANYDVTTKSKNDNDVSGKAAPHTLPETLDDSTVVASPTTPPAPNISSSSTAATKTASAVKDDDEDAVSLLSHQPAGIDSRDNTSGLGDNVAIAAPQVPSPPPPPALGDDSTAALSSSSSSDATTDDDDDTITTFSETNLLVASFEGWMHGGPDGTNELRWKISQVRDAREFS